MYKLNPTTTEYARLPINVRAFKLVTVNKVYVLCMRKCWSSVRIRCLMIFCENIHYSPSRPHPPRTFNRSENEDVLECPR